MYFTDDDGYPKFLVFAPMLDWLTLDNNINNIVTNWTSTEISPQKIKPFDCNLAFNLANVRIGRNVNNSVFMQKYFSSLYSNSNLNL